MTAVTAGPPVILDGPLPTPPSFSLLTVAQLPPAVEANGDLASRWLNGVAVYTYPSSTGSGWDTCVSSTLAPTKDAGDGPDDFPVFGSFTGFLPVTCSAFALTWDEFVRRANVVMDATDANRLERQLSMAEFKTDNPALKDATDLLNTGAATKTVESLALLEDAIGDTGRGGVIHATPATVIAWMSWNLLVQQQGQLRTLGGTPVIRGTGYIGAHPTSKGAPGATQAWAWATGPVVYQRGGVITTPSTLAEALDRTDNTVVYRAERDLLVAWDTVLNAAVLVDRSL